MIFFGARLSLGMIPRILLSIVALFELLVVLRVLLKLILRLTGMPEGRAASFLTGVTEPAVAPVREVMNKIIGTGRIDFSPAVTVALLELLQWLIKVIF